MEIYTNSKTGRCNYLRYHTHLKLSSSALIFNKKIYIYCIFNICIYDIHMYI